MPDWRRIILVGWTLNLLGILAFFLLGPGMEEAGVPAFVMEIVLVLPALAFLRWDRTWAYVLAAVLIALWPLAALFAFGGYQDLYAPRSAGHAAAMWLHLLGLLVGVGGVVAHLRARRT